MTVTTNTVTRRLKQETSVVPGVTEAGAPAQGAGRSAPFGEGSFVRGAPSPPLPTFPQFAGNSRCMSAHAVLARKSVWFSYKIKGTLFSFSTNFVALGVLSMPALSQVLER